jgi:protoporphyrinogen IX oxidase
MNGLDRKTLRRLAMLLAVAIVLAIFIALPDRFYQWVRAFHIIAVIAWMAGMLYLPRLFVYHAEIGAGTPQSETFKVMERRLLRFIMEPAIAATWLLGLWLAWRGFGFMGGWLHLKIAAVIVLSGLHGYFSASAKRFAEDRNEKSARHWRFMNEAPTALMIVIVILAVIKPWS